MFLTISSQL